MSDISVTETHVQNPDRVIRKNRKRPPHRTQYMPQKPRVNEVLGTGHIVSHRGSKSKRLRMNPFPFEHGDLGLAIEEAVRLAKANPGERYEVFSRPYVVQTDKDGNVVVE